MLSYRSNFLIIFALCASSILASKASASEADQFATFKDVNEVVEQLPSPRAALTRFLFYNSRPNERQGAAQLALAGGPLGYKRSSSALDALTGVTLGKRAAPMELVNFEPLFSRQYGMRSMPRMYDLRWSTRDAYEGPTNNYN